MRAVWFGVSLCVFGCAAQTPAPATPTSSDDTATASAPASGTDADAPTNSGHSLDVGMEFKDKGDDENRRAHRDAPPTAAWRPVEKDKAADPKKAVTASR